jgi:hypothetical protein
MKGRSLSPRPFHLQSATDSLLALISANSLTIMQLNKSLPAGNVCHLLHISLQYGGCAAHLRHTVRARFDFRSGQTSEALMLLIHRCVSPVTAASTITADDKTKVYVATRRVNGLFLYHQR